LPPLPHFFADFGTTISGPSAKYGWWIANRWPEARVKGRVGYDGVVVWIYYPDPALEFDRPTTHSPPPDFPLGGRELNGKWTGCDLARHEGVIIKEVS